MFLPNVRRLAGASAVTAIDDEDSWQTGAAFNYNVSMMRTLKCHVSKKFMMAASEDDVKLFNSMSAWMEPFTRLSSPTSYLSHQDLGSFWHKLAKMFPELLDLISDEFTPPAVVDQLLGALDYFFRFYYGQNRKQDVSRSSLFISEYIASTLYFLSICPQHRKDFETLMKKMMPPAKEEVAEIEGKRQHKYRVGDRVKYLKLGRKRPKYWRDVDFAHQCVTV